MTPRATPDLSIIVPTYNESATLPILLDSLAKQIGVDFELIIADAGSSDETTNIVHSFANNATFQVTLVESSLGRGQQLNAGVAKAVGGSLLFLHADSSFCDRYALADGLYYFDDVVDNRGTDMVAGHFALTFVHSKTGPRPGYAFFESKARLNRRGCIHGDQGFLVRHTFFNQIGMFDTSFPFLEDERFADAVSEIGEWVLLPSEIQTSARRFETEGLLQRQLLNALIMNASAIGWVKFLHQAPSLYQLQGEAGRLSLFPFFQQLKQLLQDMTRKERLHTWYRSGTYVRDNGWQLLFAVDVWLGRRQNESYRGELTPVLDRYECWFDRLSDHFGGRLLAAGVLWVWFHATLSVMKLRPSLASVFRLIK